MNAQANPPPPPGGYDPAYCLTVLKQAGLNPCEGFVSNFHCIDAVSSGNYHTICAQQAMYMPVQISICLDTATNKALWFPTSTFFQQCAAQGPGWGPSFCFCCCACFAGETPIATPTGVVKIDTVQEGEELLVATLSAGGGKPNLTWTGQKVSLSVGTGPSEAKQPTMVWLVYGATSTTEIICSSGQPFLLDSGKFITAGQIVPGMNLVDQNGNSVPVQLASVGEYTGGVHHVAIEAPWLGSPDNHLILTAGVVTGDYTLQSHYYQIEASYKAGDEHSYPLIGSPEYAAKHGAQLQAHPLHVTFQSSASAAGAPVDPSSFKFLGRFKAYLASGKTATPIGASSFFTPDQAKDILKNGQQVPLGNPIPQLMFQSVAKQMAGFYPDVTFYYDAMNVVPNLHAFEQYGKKFVVVNGGLARVVGLQYEGLAMAMAHGIGAFYAGAPQTVFGLSGVGVCDYYAFGAISRAIWIGSPWLTYSQGAYNQWSKVFALVDASHQGGSNPVTDPSLSCRLGTAESAFAGGNLPECAGGEAPPKLDLEQAAATGPKTVSLTFSVGISAPGATDPANYSVESGTTIVTAAYNPTKNFVIDLTLDKDLEPGGNYVASAKNLTSYLGGVLTPDPATADFTAP